MTQPVDPFYPKIKLTKGQFATVDAFLFDWLSEYKWQAQWNPCTRSYYARGQVNGRPILMHRLILGIENEPPDILGDHEDQDTLNNRGTNLRRATHQQNQYNKKVRRDSNTGLKGASSYNHGGYRARITVNKKQIFLGRFDTPGAAHTRYQEEALKIAKEFASW